MPQVSVVVPVYNAEKYIAETLASIAGQSFVDFDVHVVDDCSTDASAKIVQEFCARDPRFHYHRSPSNFGGPAGPRNLGIDKSAGEYVAFCDADDLWAPFKLEVQLAIAKNSGADVVSAVVRDFADGEAPAPFDRPNGVMQLTGISHRRLLLKNWIALSSVMARRASLLAAGPFNTARTHIAVEDFDMWLRVTARGGRVVRIGTPLVHYRKLSTSISASKSMMVRKALNVLGEDYARRGKADLFRLLRPVHWILYVGTSAWMRAVRREL
ncbi:MAG: glycosyltransferase family 2 protein [Alphaproteobacteria bacterium]|nr:glycosyltransferase family 2 protein [Alphaproteobacteria bacterium]MBU0864424.1 glycosyltransferase family 2 protein [Alphaproteobacteria bacterium]MBU1823961.1 glycosyltransferase family 2 protein [Alphaproteobacteria bacterium]